MASTYVVAADVVDITADRPQPTDAFLVDTNVWYWQTYTRASQSGSAPNPRQTRIYPNYLSVALRQKSRLLRCGLSLVELCHLIEKVELELCGRRLTIKEFRQAPDRAKVLSEIRASWSQAERMAQLLDTNLDEKLLSSGLDRLAAPLDAVDALMIEAALRSGVNQVITDDGDFCSVGGITLFTGNRGVVEAARTAGRLIARKPPEQPPQSKPSA